MFDPPYGSKEFNIETYGYEEAWRLAVSFREGATADAPLIICPPPPEMPPQVREYLDNISNHPSFNRRHLLPDGISLQPSRASASCNYKWRVDYKDPVSGDQKTRIIDINKYGYQTAWKLALFLLSENTGIDVSDFVNQPPACPDFLKSLNIQESGNYEELIQKNAYRGTRIILKRFPKTLIFFFNGKPLGLPNKHFDILVHGYDGAWRKARSYRMSVLDDGTNIPLNPPPLSSEDKTFINELKSSISIFRANSKRPPYFMVNTGSGRRLFSIRKEGYEGAWNKAREFLLELVDDKTKVPAEPPPITQEIIDGINRPSLRTGSRKLK